MRHIPIRWIISCLGLYACALLFAQRAAMSVAVVAMTRGHRDIVGDSPPTNKSLTRAIHYCADVNSTSRTFTDAFLFDSWIDDEEEVDELRPEFDWSESLQGVILGSAFYLYFIVPTLAGRLTDSLGGKWITFVGVLGPCVLTALIPVTVRGVGVGALIALQTLVGGFHGAIYPSVFALHTKYFPPKERANANAGIILGGALGNSIAYALSGYLCETTIGWPLVFYVLSAIHVPWLLLWLYFVTSDPSDNRRLSDQELIYIKTNVPQVPKRNLSAPWSAILTSIPVWTCVVTKVSGAFGYFLLLAKVPSFLSNIFGVPIIQNGSFSAAATCSTGISSLIASPLANWLIARYKLRSIVVRKAFQTVALLGPAISLALITALECNLTAAIALIFTAMFCYGMLTGGEWSVISSFCPNFSGTVMGFAHLLPFATGFIGPYVVGVILDTESGTLNDKWNLILYITAGLYLIGTVAFIFGATDQQQPWDILPEEEEDSTADKEFGEPESHKSMDGKKEKGKQENEILH